jgi:hypothetical protein
VQRGDSVQRWGGAFRSTRVNMKREQAGMLQGD